MTGTDWNDENFFNGKLSINKTFNPSMYLLMSSTEKSIKVKSLYCCVGNICNFQLKHNTTLERKDLFVVFPVSKLVLFSV